MTVIGPNMKVGQRAAGWVCGSLSMLSTCLVWKLSLRNKKDNCYLRSISLSQSNYNWHIYIQYAYVCVCVCVLTQFQKRNKEVQSHLEWVSHWKKMWSLVIKVEYQSAWHELVLILMKCHPVSKQVQHFYAVGCTEKQILHIIYLFVEELFKGLGRLKIPFCFWHNILEPHFTLSFQCWGMPCIHSFHISCLCYFLCSFIRLSNKLMVF